MLAAAFFSFQFEAEKDLFTIFFALEAQVSTAAADNRNT
jgi:hypothetical protein